MVRQAYPQAELHVIVASHITSLLDCVPWVNRVWGYMRYPRHANLRENWEMISRLRREKFDVVINLNGSDRSSHPSDRPPPARPWRWAYYRLSAKESESFVLPDSIFYLRFRQCAFGFFDNVTAQSFMRVPL
jgi:hypothetical protein